MFNKRRVKFEKKCTLLPVDVSKIVLANSVDPDQMPHSVASDLSLHCVLWPVCPNI